VGEIPVAKILTPSGKNRSNGVVLSEKNSISETPRHSPRNEEIPAVEGPTLSGKNPSSGADPSGEIPSVECLAWKGLQWLGAKNIILFNI